jgi:hypothetical protein
VRIHTPSTFFSTRRHYKRRQPASPAHPGHERSRGGGGGRAWRQGHLAIGGRNPCCHARPCFDWQPTPQPPTPPRLIVAARGAPTSAGGKAHRKRATGHWAEERRGGQPKPPFPAQSLSTRAAAHLRAVCCQLIIQSRGVAAFASGLEKEPRVSRTEYPTTTANGSGKTPGAWEALTLPRQLSRAESKEP